jgi:hypothetical protein
MPNGEGFGVDQDPENPNPIVAMANKIRARKKLEEALASAAGPHESQADNREGDQPGESPPNDDAAAGLAAFGRALQDGIKRLNSILGKNAVVFVRLEKPLRLRVRFGEKRVSLDLDEGRQLVIVSGDGLEGEYQFDTGASVPALVNLSKLSTEAGYRDALTSSTLLKHVSRDAVLPRPPHLDDPGPLRF